jgi:BioD-like phosphotransacetylase family protein
MPHHAPKTAKLLKHLSLKPQNLKASHAQKQTESNSPNMRVETGTSNTLDEVENFSQHIQSRRHQKSAQKEQSPTTKFQTGGNK